MAGPIIKDILSQIKAIIKRLEVLEAKVDKGNKKVYRR